MQVDYDFSFPEPYPLSLDTKVAIAIASWFSRQERENSHYPGMMYMPTGAALLDWLTEDEDELEMVA